MRVSREEADMAELTVHGVDPDLERQIEEVAEREGVPVERAALDLLRRAAKQESPAAPKGKIGHALDEFFGDWSDEEAREFIESVEVFEQIDESLWK
jgi:hypothetical protein